MCSLVLERVRISFQNVEVNMGSQLETSDRGMSCGQTISAKNSLATVSVVYGCPKGMKWQYFEKRSMTVRMMDLPPTLGRPSMKSNATSAEAVVSTEGQ
jgi:hypothetical protein